MTMEPKQWNDLFRDELASPKVLRATVDHHARAHLATLAQGVTISTEALVESLYPRALAELSLLGDVTRDKIFTCVLALAKTGMEDCCKKGEPSGKCFGKVKRPWLWFAPLEHEKCPACGQSLPGKI